MSRIRTTLDSVTKAVGSTDLISKFSRLKPGTANSTHVEKVLFEAETNCAAASPSPETSMKEKKSTSEEEVDKQQQDQIDAKPFAVSQESSSVSEAKGSAPISSSSLAKQTVQLFQPAGLSTNMDETYRILAQHINSYFGTSTPVEEGGEQPQQHQAAAASEPILSTASQKSADETLVMSLVSETKSIEASTSSPSPPAPPTSHSENPTHIEAEPSTTAPDAEKSATSAPDPASSPKKGFTHYLSYPRPSVQAFVGSYIAPLVPKFRHDSKSIAAEKHKLPEAPAEQSTVDKAGEKTDSEEEKAQKQKERLLAQREKVFLQFPHQVSYG